MKKLLGILVLALLWCNVGIAEVKSKNYKCSGESFGIKIEYDLNIKKKYENFYDIYHSGMPDEDPQFCKFLQKGNMIMWYSTYKEGNDRTLFINMFEAADSGNTHLLLTVNKFKSSSEFDKIHRMYEAALRHRKDTENIDPAKHLLSEIGFSKEADKITQKALQKKTYEILTEIKCD